ncbi:GNAT family N-acetyltransferase [Clostridium sp.]|uniref:GNAT family N-acetyltransferase n=1 Tax=Clostridium sp. TaxID=1506 RepID=UPI002FC79B9A
MRFRLISDYKNNEKYRKSFSNLAKNTFGLNFERWFQEGYCNDNYISYSYIDNDEVIANVSINKFTVIVDGKINNAIQLGTVMTDKLYRNEGLIRSLMNEIFKIYEKDSNFIYLFANDSVLNFYPKFGFKKVVESTYEIDLEEVDLVETNIRKLDVTCSQDHIIINRLCETRVPISNQLGIVNDKWPLKVYCNFMYSDNIYYINEDDCIIILSRYNGIINLYDILSESKINLDTIIEKVVCNTDKKIIINFIPNCKKYKVKKGIKEEDDDTLFVRSNVELFNGEVLFPNTSHT